MSGTSLLGVLLFAGVLGAAWSWSGCNDNPTQIGEGYLPQNVKFEQLHLPLSEFSITSGISAVSNGSNDLNDALLVGKAEDGTVAHGLLALIDNSDLLRDITPDQILKAELRMRTFNYRYGDTASRQIEFDVTSIEGTFGSRAKWEDDLIATINAGTNLGSYAGSYQDTTTISVELTPDRIAEFLNSYYRIDTVVPDQGDTLFQTVTLRTLALRASDNGKMIGSFLGTTTSSVADSVRPQLRITLQDTVINLTMGVSNWVAQYPDSFESGPGIIAIGGGVPIRTLIKFRLDSIPDGAVIHRAELTLQINPALSSQGTTGQTSRVIAYVAGEDPLGENFLATYPSIGQIFLRGSRPAKDDESLEDEIIFSGFGTTIKQWLGAERNIGNPESAIPNNGLILSIDKSLPNLESGTVDRLGFYGLDAPEELRPKLTIIYSIQTDV